MIGDVISINKLLKRSLIKFKVVCVLVSQCQVSLVNGLIDSLEKAVQTDAGCFLLLNNPTKQKETRARVRQPLASSTSAALAGGGETIEQDTGDPPWPPPLLPPTLLVRAAQP